MIILGSLMTTYKIGGIFQVQRIILSSISKFYLLLILSKFRTI